MISHLARWIVATFLVVIPSVVTQMMYPMFPPPPVQIAVPMPVPVPFIVRETTPKTTTTPKPRNSPESGIGFVAMPMPMPVPLAFPAFPALACQGNGKKRPKNCPPCPPCVCQPACTPRFFSYCSPCHQKCSCRSKEDTPTPIPPPKPAEMGPPYGVAVPVPPMFAPPPVVVIPFPPPPPRRRLHYYDSSDCSDCTYTETESTEEYSSSSSSSSTSSNESRNKKHGYALKKPRPRPHRRRFASTKDSGNELVKPVLTYLSKNGDIKLRRRLTNAQAAELMNEKPYQKISVVGGKDERNMPRISITSNTERRSGQLRSNHRRRQVILSQGMAEHILGEGKKELVFRPPGGKKISNLTVSFQIRE